MSSKLRVFVSSTMKDLANERDAVARRLLAFNFEPLNAEGWLPTGAGSWARIEQEIESCHVFLLIIGERYGWIPKEGPKADLGLSVTHLEYKEARNRGIPIIPFLKRLAYDTDRSSDDAKRRDQFREEVSSWAKGEFIADFELANDLADAVGHALVGLLTDEFLGSKIRERAPAAQRAANRLEVPQPSEGTRRVDLPARLVSAAAKREAVLFAGAGISMSAGLPSAAVFAEHLAQILYRNDIDYAVSPVAAAFAAIASDVEAYTSRDFLVREVTKVLNPPQGLRPTLAHTEAVRSFDLIVTTNWDNLFEEAAAAQGIPLTVQVDDNIGRRPERTLIKLHGSLDTPTSLVLTETDVVGMERTHPRVWQEVRDIVRQGTLIVVGTSLRDLSIIKLFEDAQPQSPGYFVVPKIFGATTARLRKWNLECIASDADTFFESLADAVKNLPNQSINK